MGQYDMDWDAVLKDASDNDTQAPIPPTDYDVEILTAEPTTFQSGSTGIKLKMKVVSGPHEDRWLWDNLVMKEGQARSISVRNMLSIGVDRDWLQSANPGLDQVADKLVGMRCTAVVGIKTYQGQERNEVKAYKAGGGVPPAPTAAAPPAPAPTPTAEAPSAATPPAPTAPSDGPPKPF